MSSSSRWFQFYPVSKPLNSTCCTHSCSWVRLQVLMSFFFFNLFAVPQGVWDLSPLTSAPALAAQSINH